MSDPLADVSSALRRAIAAAVPGRTVECVEYPTGSDRPGNEVVRLSFADAPGAYLKIATADDATERIAREAALARFVGANAAVRTPAVLAADAGADPPFLATRPLAGERLADRLESDEQGNVDPDSLASVLTRVGQATAGLHAARFDRAGAVTGGDESGLDLVERSWPRLLREQVVEAHSVPERFVDLPERAGDLLRERSAVLELDGDRAATVVHDDLHAQNVFDAGGETDTTQGRDPDRDPDEPDLGVLDLESAMVGDPGFDLARTEDLAIDGRPDLTEAERETARAALRVGYRTGAAAHGLPVPPAGLPSGFEAHRETYRVVTFLLTAVTFERWAPGAPEPVEDLAAWVHEEFDRRLALARGETG